MSEQVPLSGGNVLIKTLGFSLALTLVFTLTAHLVPQVEGEAPSEQQVDTSSMTMDDFVALGEDLFSNKGTCTLCHKPPPLGRAPDIQGDDMQVISAERLADERYKGVATDAASYLRESMVDPGVYVAAGWGKKGSNDTESPMPRVDKAPIDLSQIEIDAIIAYLQAKDGNEITVALPSSQAAVEVASDKPAQAASSSAAATAQEALGKYACSSCHALDNDDALVGPGLATVGARLSKAQIRQSILDPNAVISEGFPPAMPADFADKMTIRELEMVVQFLAEKK